MKTAIKVIFALAILSLVGCASLTRSSLNSRIEQVGPTDYYLDLFSSNSYVRSKFFLKEGGMSNLHVLYIYAHGTSKEGFRLTPDGESRMMSQSGFNFKHVANCFTTEQLKDIHNVYIAACDSGKTLDTKQVVNAFPSCTNVVHITPGYQGFQDAFEEAIFFYRTNKGIFNPPYIHSHCWVDWNTGERFPLNKWKNTCYRQAPYVADLFLPGRKTPFARVIATRDLLQSPLPVASLPVPPAEPISW